VPHWPADAFKKPQTTLELPAVLVYIPAFAACPARRGWHAPMLLAPPLRSTAVHPAQMEHHFMIATGQTPAYKIYLAVNSGSILQDLSWWF
jgi:hypothetical protein